MKKKHVLMMIACCLIPVAGLLVINFFSIPLNSVLWFALVLLCPLSHLLMMKFMVHDGHASHNAAQNQLDHHHPVTRHSDGPEETARA